MYIQLHEKGELEVESHRLSCTVTPTIAIWVYYPTLSSTPVQRRYMDEILPIRHKTLSNQSINHCTTGKISWNSIPGMLDLEFIRGGSTTFEKKSWGREMVYTLSIFQNVASPY